MKSGKGSEIKARTTMYKGIRMRSRLEANFAAFLDQAGTEWDYEPVCFAGPDGQWLPDFRVAHDGRNVYFEVKPESLPDDDIDVVATRMTVAWLTEPDAILHLAIWRYDDPARSASLMGIPREDDEDLIWWYAEGAGDKHAWPGMGQLEATCERVRLEHETGQVRDDA